MFYCISRLYENKLVPWSYSFFCDILLLAVILWKKKKKPLGKYLLSFCRKNTREMNVEVLPVSLSLLLTLNSYLAITLRERCPSMEFFLVRIFSHSDRLRRFTVFSPNTGKYRSEKTPYLDTFQAVLVVSFIDNKKKKHVVFGQKPWSTGRQLNVQKAPCWSSKRLLYVQFTYCLQRKFTHQISY